MEGLPDEFVRYVSQVTGKPVTWHGAVVAPLPQYLAQLYDLHEVGIAQRRFLGIVVRDSGKFRPAGFVKHLVRLRTQQESCDGFVLIARQLPAYVRQRLVERQIPFVVPGRQLNWPELGAAIQGRGRRAPPMSGQPLLPATQVVILHFLNAGLDQPVAAGELAQRLGYSAMSMSRALDEIEANALGKVTRAGRVRQLEIPDGRSALWARAESMLRSPVRKTVRVGQDALPASAHIPAGESALAHYSMLTPPVEPVYALGPKTWKAMASTIETIPVEDEGSCRLQVWRYDPVLFAGEHTVDPFSLYLSLRDEGDDRVQMALNEIMEQLHGQGTGPFSRAFPG